MRRLLLILVGGLVVGGCKEKEAAPPLAPAPPPPSVPSFRADIAPVMERMCTRARGCHGGEATPEVDLDLRAGMARVQLVGQRAAARPGAVRVKPGDAEGSFLIAKLANKLGAGEGRAMPLDPRTGTAILPSPVGGDYVEKILKPWILAGAPDN